MNLSGHEQRRREVKARLVAAHRAGDWELFRRVNRVYDRLKRALRCQWPGCGMILSHEKQIRSGKIKRSEFCHMHWRPAKRAHLISSWLALSIVMGANGQDALIPPEPTFHFTNEIQVLAVDGPWITGSEDFFFSGPCDGIYWSVEPWIYYAGSQSNEPPGTTYIVQAGRGGNIFTRQYNTGTNLSAPWPFPLPPLVVTVTSPPPALLESATCPNGPWTDEHVNSLNLTNPPGNRFFRAFIPAQVSLFTHRN